MSVGLSYGNLFGDSTNSSSSGSGTTSFGSYTGSSSDSSSSWWGSIVNNLGSIESGAAAIINATKSGSSTPIYLTNGTPGNGNNGAAGIDSGTSTLLWVVGGIVFLVLIVFMFLKISKK